MNERYLLYNKNARKQRLQTSTKGRYGLKEKAGNPFTPIARWQDINDIFKYTLNNMYTDVEAMFESTLTEWEVTKQMTNTNLLISSSADCGSFV